MRYAYEVVAIINDRPAGAVRDGMVQTKESAWRIRFSQQVTCRVKRIRVPESLFAQLPK